MHLDLHVHTTASDGTLTPAELVSRAISSQISTLAITDHDSVDGVDQAMQAAKNSPLTVIPGVELSALHEGRDVHILGYFIDHRDSGLRDRLTQLREARRQRAGSIVAALRDAGYELTLDEVLELSAEGSVGRSHVARALVSRGHAPDIAQAFERFIGRGAPFYISKPVTEPADVIRLVRSAGGVAVLAHPGVTRLDDAIPDLVNAGLQGLEAYHGEHTPEMQKRYADLARRHSLIVTGGSDYHGPQSSGPSLGSIEMPAHVLPDLFARAARTPAIPTSSH